jgi:hypothetical protein
MKNLVRAKSGLALEHGSFLHCPSVYGGFKDIARFHSFYTSIF